MNNHLEEALVNIVCNSPTNVTDIAHTIENKDCTATAFNSDFSFRRCEVGYQPFVSMVNSITKYFSTCVSKLLVQPEPPEYISHIEIFKNDAMGAEGIKYLVKSACDFICNFTKKALELNLEKQFNFVLSFVNNSIIQNISIFEDCPAAEIHSELFPHGTELHLVFIDGNQVTNNSCLVANNITDNIPPYLPLHHHVPASIGVVPVVLGCATLGVLMTTAACLIDKYIERTNDNVTYSRASTINNSIASGLNHIIPRENNQLPIIGEMEEGVV